MNNVWKKYGTNYPALNEDIKCGAAIVGGGLTGVILAYLLSRRGIDTVLFEENNVSSGKTALSTAKVTLAHGLHYAELWDKVSPDAAQKYAAANLAGLAFYAEHLGDEYRRDMYLYTLYGERRLMREYDTLVKCGVGCEFVRGGDVPLPFKTAAAIKFPAQYEIDPVEFAHKLCWEGTFRVYENSRAEVIDEHRLAVGGHTVYADRVAVCTNYPLRIPSSGAPLKLSRKSSCAVTLTSPAGFPIPRGIMAYGADGGYGYRYAGNGNTIIASGETSRGAPPPNAILRIVSAVRAFAPDAVVVGRWVNNDTYTHDGIPYAGRLRSGIYMACGYSAWGMTNSASSAIILAEEMCGRDVPYADVFSPHRNFLAGGRAEFTEHMSTSALGVTKSYSPPPDVLPKEIKPGSAAVVNYRGKRAGAYRDGDGSLHYVSVRCPHLGCELEWDPVHKTWDCPCHGSRFSYTGECLSNPATKSIKME